MVTSQRQIFTVLSLLLLALGFGLMGDSQAAPGSATERTVRGEVTAVTADTQPQVIVVKTMTADKKEMIVAATLGSETVVTRGKKRVALSDIRVGETITLGYLKSPEGLAAKTIHAH